MTREMPWPRRDDELNRMLEEAAAAPLPENGPWLAVPRHDSLVAEETGGS